MISISVVVFLSNMSFGRVKEMSQGDISFTHAKPILLETIIN